MIVDRFCPAAASDLYDLLNVAIVSVLSNESVDVENDRTNNTAFRDVEATIFLCSSVSLYNFDALG